METPFRGFHGNQYIFEKCSAHNIHQNYLTKYEPICISRTLDICLQQFLLFRVSMVTSPINGVKNISKHIILYVCIIYQKNINRRYNIQCFLQNPNSYIWVKGRLLNWARGSAPVGCSLALTTVFAFPVKIISKEFCHPA